jgi:hypothetical protein
VERRVTDDEPEPSRVTLEQLFEDRREGGAGLARRIGELD